MARKRQARKRRWQEIVFYVITLLIALTMAFSYVLIALK